MKAVYFRVILIGASLGGLAVCGCTERGQVLHAGRHVGEAGTPRESGPPAWDASALGSVSMVSVGTNHACAIEDAVAYCWGKNESGQLGTGDERDQLRPTRIRSDEAWRSIAAGTTHSCALTTNGEVFCWGSNTRGQLGQGDRSPRLLPTRVALSGQAQLLDTRFSHACALLTPGGELYCWGENSEGQLGQEDEYPGDNSNVADALLPLRVGNAEYVDIAVGQGHSCGIVSDRQLQCWGRNSHHELGLTGPEQVRRPSLVESTQRWKHVYAGQHHTCAIADTDTLWCWGGNTGNSTGEGAPLGIPTQNEVDAPTRVPTSQTWVSFATDTFHSCGIDDAAGLWCWGRNIEGQLGVGDLQTRREPSLVASGYRAVDTGRFATCAVSTNGQVLCSGKNDSGILGNGTTVSQNALAATEP